MFRNRAYDSRTGRWTQEDPIGVAGGLNLYQFNGNDPVAYTDPFGLCPEKLRVKGKERECSEWNQAQVAKARQVIYQNDSKSEVLPLGEDQPVAGVNHDQIQQACKHALRRTNRGCITSEGLIIVNADRSPENIAATIQHELVHAGGPPSERSRPLGPFGEQCALHTEILTGRIFRATLDRLSPRVSIDPRARCK
ncbi:MAG: RHS repeat-associated core domain-containing protein [Candidatus Binatia bacterium]